MTGARFSGVIPLTNKSVLFETLIKALNMDSCFSDPPSARAQALSSVFLFYLGRVGDEDTCIFFQQKMLNGKTTINKEFVFLLNDVHDSVWILQHRLFPLRGGQRQNLLLHEVWQVWGISSMYDAYIVWIRIPLSCIDLCRLAKKHNQ